MAKSTKETQHIKQQIPREFKEHMTNVETKMSAIEAWAHTKEGQKEIKKGRTVRAKALKKFRESMQD